MGSVQDLFWYTWINDGILGFQETKYYIELPVSVESTYRMTLKQETLANPFTVIMPGGKANITMDLKNTGNQYSSWSLGGTFRDPTLSPDNLKWYDLAGEEMSMVNMTPVEEMSLNAEVSIPEGMGYGTYRSHCSRIRGFPTHIKRLRMYSSRSQSSTIWRLPR